MNKKITNIARKLAYAGVALVLTLCVATTAANAEPGDLSLAQAPLFTGSNVEPNVLVAMDNSGSMDLETLFPTDSGMLYWDTARWNGLVPQLVNGKLVTNLLDSAANSETPSFWVKAKDEQPGFYNTPSKSITTDTSGKITASTKKLVPYGYLFPNGCDNGKSDGRRVYCDIDAQANGGVLGDLIPALLGTSSPLNNPDIKLIPLLLGSDSKVSINAVPPIPQFAFTRSPAFNKAYFDPRKTYNPWPGHPNAKPTAAPTDPINGSEKFNLTDDVKNDDEFWRFHVDAGMTIPQGTEVSFGPLVNLGDNTLTNLLNGLFEGVGGILDPVVNLVCKGILDDLLGGLLHCPNVLNEIVGVLGGFHELHGDWLVGGAVTGELLGVPDCSARKTGLAGILGGRVNCNSEITDLLNQLLLPVNLGIKYYPATVWLPINTTPADEPPIAGYKNTNVNAPQIGDDPAGNKTLRRYEIKSDNFESQDDYDKAIQNFANWFTYYRKRGLATRGGLATALNQVGGVRVAVTSTNSVDMNTTDNRLSMTSLDYDDIDCGQADGNNNLSCGKDRESLYTHISTIPFFKRLGAPNRQALQFLGDQLETNINIVQQSCQQNYAMLVTDGYTTDVNDTSGTPRNTMADIAKRYYSQFDTSNLSLGDHLVPTTSACDSTPHDPWLDCEKTPHMTTFGVTLGQKGIKYDPETYEAKAAPYDVVNVPWDSQAFKPNNSGLAQLDDLWHATVTGRGAMLNAKIATEKDKTDTGYNNPSIESVLKNVIALSGSSTGSASGLATQSRNLGNDQVVYQATFQSGAWSGELTARKVGRENGQLSSAKTVTASLPDPEPRNIFTVDPAAENVDGSPGGIATSGELFKTSNTNLVSEIDTDDEITQANAKKIINYIRGDRSNEQAQNGTFRNRGTNILGDIVHSTPLYVGPPDRARYPETWVDFRDPNTTITTPSYQSFVTAHTAPVNKREPIVYVGANDGMLHGFDANSLSEKFAYVPHGVIANLKNLTDPDYTHQFYVDGSPVSGDVVYGSSWRTVLVGGLRAGGRGVYALDVTDPDLFSASSVLWDLTATDANKTVNPDLGHVYGKPSIVRLHDGKWAAVFDNGYNSPNQSAGLYIVEFDAHGAASSPLFIPAQATDDTSTKPNGLSQVFPVDLDGDFITDYIYAGDLHGNLWRFDLTGGEPDEWTATKIFTATDSNTNGKPQPITAQPQVGAHPYGLDYGVMVYFGTGKYLEDKDKTSSNINNFYGIWDPNVFTVTSVHDIPELAPRSELVQQDVITPSGNDSFRSVTDKPVDYQPDANVSAQSYDRGWLLNLPPTEDNVPGERIVSNAQLQEGERGQNNTVAFSTLILSADACTSGGNGFLIILDQKNGGRTDLPVFLTNPKLNVLANDTENPNSGDENGNVSVNTAGRRISGGIPGAATHQADQSNGNAFYIVPKSDGTTETVNIPLLGKDGRVSWREIRR